MIPLMIGVGLIATIGLVSVVSLINNFDEAKETKKYINTGEEIEYLSKKSEILKNNNKYNTINGNIDIVKYGKMSDIMNKEAVNEKEVIALNKLNETFKKYIKDGNPISDLSIDYTNQGDIDALWLKLSKDNFKYTKLNEEEFNLAIKTKYVFYNVNNYNVDISELNNNLNVKKLNEKILNDTNAPIYNETENLDTNIKISKSYLNDNEIGNKNVFKKNKKINELVSNINNIINESNSGYNEYLEAFRLNIKLSRIDYISSKKLNLILNQKMLNSKNLRVEEKVILSKLNDKNIALNNEIQTEDMGQKLTVAYAKDNFDQYNIDNSVDKEEIDSVIINKNNEAEATLLIESPEYKEYVDQISEKEKIWDQEIQDNTINNKLVNVLISDDTVDTIVSVNTIDTVTSTTDVSSDNIVTVDNSIVSDTSIPIVVSNEDTTVQTTDTEDLISTFTMGTTDVEVVNEEKNEDETDNTNVVETLTTNIVNIKNF